MSKQRWLLAAVLLGTGACRTPQPEVSTPRVEVVATAKQDLKAGHTVDGLGGYDTYGVAESTPATRAEGLLPMGVAEGCVLVRDVPKDAVLTYADVTLPPGRLVDQLRDEQEKLFG